MAHKEGVFEEKFKKLKDGTSNRYVYYGCTRHKDKACKNGYVREELLIEQMVKIMDQVDFNKIAMREKFEAEVERLRKFRRSFLQTKDAKAEKDIDLCAYAKYILKDGSLTEKRELLLCIKSRLVFTRGVLTLENKKGRPSILAVNCEVFAGGTVAFLLENAKILKNFLQLKWRNLLAAERIAPAGRLRHFCFFSSIESPT